MTKLQTIKYGTRSYWRAYGDRLRVTRQTLGISESYAAAAHLVSLRTYRRYERGFSQTNSSRGVIAFCKKYAVGPDWLLLGRGRPKRA